MTLIEDITSLEGSLVAMAKKYDRLSAKLRLRIQRIRDDKRRNRRIIRRAVQIRNDNPGVSYEEAKLMSNSMERGEKHYVAARARNKETTVSKPNVLKTAKRVLNPSDKFQDLIKKLKL